MRSSEALPKENARRRRPFPGRLDSFFSSWRRLAAGESGGLEGEAIEGLGSGLLVGDSGDVEPDWESGEGLFLPVLLVAEPESVLAPSRA